MWEANRHPWLESSLAHQERRKILSDDCDRCDGKPRSAKTLENQGPMPIGRTVVYVDHCIAELVAAVNSAGISTTSSCCGHRLLRGYIYLNGDRALAVVEGTNGHR